MDERVIKNAYLNFLPINPLKLLISQGNLARNIIKQKKLIIEKQHQKKINGFIENTKGLKLIINSFIGF